MSRLSKVKLGFLDEPARIFLYGDEGVGKSTLAAAAANPIFLDLEDGTGRIDTARYTYRDGPGGHIPHSLADVRSGISDLRESKHDFKHLVFDTVDRLESLIWKYVLERDSGKVGPLNKNGKKFHSIEAYGYGKGFQVALDVWREIGAQLDDLRVHRGVGIILLGHATIRTFKNPEGEDYDRWNPRVHAVAAGFLKEWCDITGFCCYHEGGGKLTDDQIRAKGWSTGKRHIKFRRHAAYDAKSRHPLPDQVEMGLDDPWGPFQVALDVGRSLPIKKIVDLIGDELDRLDDEELTTKVRKAVVAAKTDRAKLARFLGELKNRNPKEEESENGAD